MSRNRRSAHRPPWLIAVAVFLFLGLASVGCVDADQARDEARATEVDARETVNEAAEGIAAVVTEAMEEVGNIVAEASEELSASALVDNPIPFRDLYEFLPEEIGEYTRTSREGGTPSALGFGLSAVEAEYDGPNDAEVEVTILDTGALPMVGSEGFVEWLDMEFDEESRRGWKRTTEYRGYPAMEEFRRTDGDRGRMTYTYFVERRFVVAVEGRTVTAEAVYEIRDRIDTDGLARLRDRDGG